MNGNLYEAYQKYLLTCIGIVRPGYKSGYFTTSLISEFHEGYAKLYNINAPHIAYIDKTGRVVLLKDYKSAGDFYEGLAKFQNNTTGLYGYMDASGTEVIPPKYQLAFDFHDGMARVYGPKGFGYIDHEGIEKISLIYPSADDFSDGVARVKEDDHYAFFDTAGQKLFVTKYESSPFSEGFAVAKTERGYGFMDKTGSLVSTSLYLEARNFKEGLAFVKTAEGFFFINKEGKIVLRCGEASDFQEGLSIYRNMSGFSYVDQTGKERFSINAKQARGFRCGVATIEKQMYQWIMVGPTGQLITPYGYAYLSEFNENFAIVKKQTNSRYTYIDKNGNDVIFNYYYGKDNIGNGMAIIRNNNRYGFIDGNDKVVVPCIYDLAEDFKDGFARVTLKGKNFYITKQGKKVPANKIGSLGIPHALRYKKEFLGRSFGFYNKKEEYIRLKYRPIYDYGTHILCNSDNKLYLYQTSTKQYHEIANIYKGSAMIDFADNYFIHNERLYYIYQDRFVSIDAKMVNFNSNTVARIEPLKKDEIILSYEEFCKQNGTIPSSVDENPSVQTKVEQNQEISKPESVQEAQIKTEPVSEVQSIPEPTISSVPEVSTGSVPEVTNGPIPEVSAGPVPEVTTGPVPEVTSVQSGNSTQQ